MSIFGENYILLDEGVVYRNSNENMCIVVNGSGSTDRDFGLDPYFKLYNKAKYTSATKIARISIIGPRYIEHTNSSNLEDWILNSSEKRNLNAIMIKKASSGKTVYQEMLEEMARVNHFKDKDRILSIPCPDFTKLQ